MTRILFPLFAVALLASACGDDAGNVFTLTPGDCFDDPDTFGEVSNLPIVDCAEPHQNEVYHLFDLADGDFPGDTSLQESSAEGCLAEFESYVGIEYLESELDYLFLTPTSQSWEQGDREVVCFLYRIDGENMTGSMQDAAL